MSAKNKANVTCCFFVPSTSLQIFKFQPKTVSDNCNQEPNTFFTALLMTIKTWLQIGPTSDFHIFTCANSEIDKNSADDMSSFYFI